MSFQTPITIKEVIEKINTKRYLIPNIQRELVWDTDKIERLWDSLMREYPIGSFLFWYVTKERSKDYQFYEFMRDYHKKKSRHNQKANINGENDIIAILDGQQRLTSLFLGLKGSYAEKLPYRRLDDISAYPKRRLYLNLLDKTALDDCEYDFRFLTKEEAEEKNETTFWFKVGNILDFEEEFEVNNFLVENELLGLNKKTSKFANQTLFRLYSVVNKDKIINYYLEQDSQLDKVVNIFIRINSGGEVLNYSDLLLSIHRSRRVTPCFSGGLCGTTKPH